MLELKWNKAESFPEFVVRVLNESDNKQETYKYLFDKELAKDESRKRSYLAQDIQNAVEQGRDKLFASEIVDIPKSKEFNSTSIVLAIGDIHAPFEHKNYLDFCKKIYKKYNCNKVVLLGDILDNHYSSYHETDPDSFGGGIELEKAKKTIAEYHRTFPNAMCCIGNHDALPNRKAFSNGLSKHWIKPIGEVLNTDSWKYSEHFIIDGVKYTHGTGRKARQRSQQDMISIVQAHYHSDSYIENYVGADGTRKFAVQVGCGVDIDSFAFAYGKNFAKPHLNVAVIIDGRLPIIEFME